MRNITLTFDDGSSHQYNNTPDDITPDQITARAQKDFTGKNLTNIDGGNKATASPVEGAAKATRAVLKELMDPVQGVAETAYGIGHGLVGQAVKGVAGLGGLAVGALKPGETAMGTAEKMMGAVDKGIEATKIEPTSATGKSIQSGLQTVGKVIESGKEGLGIKGQQVADKWQESGFSPETSAAAGAFVDTAVGGIEMWLGAKAPKVAGQAAKLTAGQAARVARSAENSFKEAGLAVATPEATIRTLDRYIKGLKKDTKGTADKALETGDIHPDALISKVENLVKDLKKPRYEPKTKDLGATAEEAGSQQPIGDMEGGKPTTLTPEHVRAAMEEHGITMDEMTQVINDSHTNFLKSALKGALWPLAKMHEGVGKIVDEIVGKDTNPYIRTAAHIGVHAAAKAVSPAVWLTAAGGGAMIGAAKGALSSAAKNMDIYGAKKFLGVAEEAKKPLPGFSEDNAHFNPDKPYGTKDLISAQERGWALPDLTKSKNNFSAEPIVEPPIDPNAPKKAWPAKPDQKPYDPEVNGISDLSDPSLKVPTKKELAPRTLKDVFSKLDDMLLSKTRNANAGKINELQKAHDINTYNHAKDTAKIMSTIGKLIGMSEEDVAKMSYAGSIHDLGKLNVPLDKLHFDGALTDATMEKGINPHAELGGKLAGKSIPMRAAITNHHARWDGKGRVDKLKGNDIPIEARVAAVADAFHAISSQRAYKEGLPFNIVMKIINNDKGTAFDPFIADTVLANRPIFEKLYNELSKWEKIPENTPSGKAANSPNKSFNTGATETTKALEINNVKEEINKSNQSEVKDQASPKQEPLKAGDFATKTEAPKTSSNVMAAIQALKATQEAAAKPTKEPIGEDRPPREERSEDDRPPREERSEDERTPSEKATAKLAEIRAKKKVTNDQIPLSKSLSAEKHQLPAAFKDALESYKKSRANDAKIAKDSGLADSVIYGKESREAIIKRLQQGDKESSDAYSERLASEDGNLIMYVESLSDPNDLRYFKKNSPELYKDIMRAGKNLGKSINVDVSDIKLNIESVKQQIGDARFADNSKLKYLLNEKLKLYEMEAKDRRDLAAGRLHAAEDSTVEGDLMHMHEIIDEEIAAAEKK